MLEEKTFAFLPHALILICEGMMSKIAFFLVVAAVSVVQPFLYADEQ
jgi:hypothetical protein